MSDRNPLPPFSWLRAFEAASRLGSFKQAARELHVTPSSISHQIRDLERSLGSSLFVRKTRAIELTPVGQRFFEQVQTALASLSSATEVARGRDRTRPLRIGMLPFTASEVFVPTLSRLADVLPAVEFQIESRIHLRDLRGDAGNERLDAVIRYGTGEFEGLTGIELTQVWLDVVASPDWTRSHRLSHPADLVGSPLIVLTAQPEGWQLWGRAYGLELPGAAEVLAFDNYAAALRAVEQGLGPGLALLPLAQPWIDAGRLVRPLVARVALRESMYLVFAPGGSRQPEIETVAQELRAHLRASSPPHG